MVLENNKEITCPICFSNKNKSIMHLYQYKVTHCLSCDVCFLSPMPTPEILNEHYSKSIKNNYNIELSPIRNESLQYIFRSFIKFNKNTIENSSSWCDIGCFDGALLDIAKKNNFKTFGIELQESAAAIAKIKHDDRVVCTSDIVSAFPANQKFSVISAISVIEHLISPKDIFVFAQNHLEKNGTLIIQTPNRNSLPSKILKTYWPCYAAPEHTFYFSTGSLDHLAAQHDFFRACTQAHLKTLPLGYGVQQLKNFGRKIYNIIHPIEAFIPKKLSLKIYIGEDIFYYNHTEKCYDQSK